MELYAAKRVQKSEKKLKLEKEEEKLILEHCNSISIEQRIRLDRLFGFPEPPKIVYAISKGEFVGVWWSYKEENDIDIGIIGWEVHRYRKEYDGEWKHKGCFEAKYLKKVKQTTFGDLKNGFEYKFTIKAKNSHGLSRESDFSNSVYIDPPLPFGWKRVLNDKTKEYFYMNSYSDETSLQRPDLNPYFLEECVVIYFHPRERSHLEKIYYEEIYHFEKVYLDRCEHILQELGELIERRELLFLYKLYGQTDNELVGYRRFIDLICHIKKEKMNQSYWTIETDELFQDKNKDKRIPKKTPKQQDYNIGEWTVSYHLGAKKWFYFHSDTPDIQWWCMPDEVRFYLPPEDYDRVHEIFNYGMIERLKLQFLEINSSRTGQINDYEWTLFLEVLQIECDQVSRALFFNSLDLNRSGFIEYNEFMMLMCQVYEKKSNLLDNFINEFIRIEFLREICMNGPVTNIDPSTNRKRILYRGKSGQNLEDELNNKLNHDEEQKHNGDEDNDDNDNEVMGYNNNNKNNNNGRTNQYRVKSAPSKEVRFQSNRNYNNNNNQNNQNNRKNNVNTNINQNRRNDPELSGSGSGSGSSSSKNKSWFQRLNCLRSNKIAAMQTAFLELTTFTKPPGPHGRYCLCGCRSPSVR